MYALTNDNLFKPYLGINQHINLTYIYKHKCSKFLRSVRRLCEKVVMARLQELLSELITITITIDTCRLHVAHHTLLVVAAKGRSSRDWWHFEHWKQDSCQCMSCI